MEIDNYKSDDDPYIVLPYYGDGHEWITVHSPEVLSTAQRDYLEDQILNRIEGNIMVDDKNSDEWEKYIDKDQLARFYVCQEIMGDCESFHGSCYLYKDMGEEEKWKFGPVWDFGNTFCHGSYGGFIYEDSPFGQRWIGDLAKFPAFQSKVKEVWKLWKGNQTESLYASIDEFCERISKAVVFDARKWPQYGHSDVNQRKQSFLKLLNGRIEWLTSQWGEGISGVKTIPNPERITPDYDYTISGQRVTGSYRGIVIRNGRKVVLR